MRSYLDFEKPVAEIEARLEELRALEAGDSAPAIGEEIARLEAKAAQTLKDIYAGLTPWQKTQVARHHERPRSTEACRDLGVPNVAAIIGVGGSGGAIAVATANRVLMLEHSFYSVISPEGAASILWRDTSKAEEAATSMKITAQDLARFGIIDQIVTEPIGGAHRDPQTAIASTGNAIAVALDEITGYDRESVRRLRREKFLDR